LHKVIYKLIACHDVTNVRLLSVINVKQAISYIFLMPFINKRDLDILVELWGS